MIQAQPNPPATARIAESVGAMQKEVAKTRLSGLKVLVVDDSRTIRRSAEILLEQAGCEVILAEDGFDALDKISTCVPDLIFADVLMPRLDGYQTCALIKRSAIYRHIPVVMLTSKDSLFDRARGYSAGSSQYLTKPFTKETLLKTVEAHVPATHAGSPTLHRQDLGGAALRNRGHLSVASHSPPTSAHNNSACIRSVFTASSCKSGG